MLQSAERGADLTRQLLAFSRKQVIAPKSIDLSRLIARLHPMLVRLLGGDIVLTTVPQQPLGSVWADPSQIEQVVLNLAINARDAMPNAGKLTIETRDVNLDESYSEGRPNAVTGACVMLAVSDNGSGMPPEIQKQIFEPFFTTKQLGQGAGLGPVTVLGIVEQHGGRIEVYSEPGQGTSFKAYFPRVATAAETPEAARAREVGGGHETVLVVEDDETLRRLATKLLKRREFRLLAAASGSEAQAALQRHEGPVHLLFTDVVLPDMNGRELVSRIAETRPSIQVLYTSGYTHSIIAHHGVLDEGVRFIAKPYSADERAARIREVLDESAS